MDYKHEEIQEKVEDKLGADEIPDLTFIFSVGIFFMLFALITVIGKLIVYLPICWWLYYLLFSRRADVKQTKVRILLVALLVLSLFEAYKISSIIWLMHLLGM